VQTWAKRVCRHSGCVLAMARRAGRLWFIRNSLDRDFYSADEAAILMKGQVPDGAFATLRQAFRDETIRFLLKPGTITEGFIFLPRQRVAAMSIFVSSATHMKLAACNPP
jgi:hypothetical protein